MWQSINYYFYKTNYEEKTYTKEMADGTVQNRWYRFTKRGIKKTVMIIGTIGDFLFTENWKLKSEVQKSKRVCVFEEWFAEDIIIIELNSLNMKTLRSEMKYYLKRECYYRKQYKRNGKNKKNKVNSKDLI